MQVDPTTAAAQRDTGTGRVYFCSAAYDAEPQRYAATAGTTPAEDSRQAAMVTGDDW